MQWCLVRVLVGCFLVRHRLYHCVCRWRRRWLDSEGMLLLVWRSYLWLVEPPSIPAQTSFANIRHLYCYIQLLSLSQWPLRHQHPCSPDPAVCVWVSVCPSFLRCEFPLFVCYGLLLLIIITIQYYFSSYLKKYYYCYNDTIRVRILL